MALCDEKDFVHHEVNNSLYSVSAFYISQITVYLVQNIIMPLIYLLIVYWGVGFERGFVNFSETFIIYYLLMFLSISIGMWKATLFRTHKAGQSV